MRFAFLGRLVFAFLALLPLEKLTAQGPLSPPAEIDPRLVDLGPAPQPSGFESRRSQTAIVPAKRRAMWGAAAMVAGAAAGAAIGTGRQARRPDDEFAPALTYGLLIGGMGGAILGTALPSKPGTRCSLRGRLLRTGGGAIGGLAVGALVGLPLGLTGTALVPGGTVAGAALAVRACH